MPERITLPCSNGFTLRVEGENLVVSTKKKDETIPISHIQSFSLKEPGLMYGTISFKTAQAASAGVNLGFGFSAALGADHNYFYPKASVDIAHALRDYVLGYEGRQAALAAQARQPAAVSVVDELRGLKSLLDDGIISQAEYDAKKAQLLSL